MPNTLSTATSRVWENSSAPGLSETNAERGNFFLDTTTKLLYLCTVPTGGAQTWAQVPYASATPTNHGVAIGDANGYLKTLAVAATGTVLAGSTGADPAFTATPSVTSITLGGGTALAAYLEQQTWTPVVTGSGAAGSGTYSTQAGYYTRIGNMIFAQFELVWSAHTGTGDMTVTGFPFAVRNSANYNPEVVLGCSNLTWPASCTMIEGHILPNTTTLLLYGTGSGIAASAVQMDGAASLHGVMIYLT